MTQANANLAYFPLVPGSKLPAVTEWQKTKPGQYPAAGNYGIALQPTDLVLDFDVWKAGGRDSLNRFIENYPGLTTRVVQTPRGGAHVYLSKPSDLRFRKKQPAWPGVDFLSDGSYVCGPGTSTVASKDSGEGSYVLVGDPEIAPAPKVFLDSLEIAEPATQTGGEVTFLMEDQFRLDCERAEPATRGSRGITAFKVAARARDLGLPKETAYQHMRDLWLPRWQEPFSESELWTQVEHAYKYAKNAPGNKTPEAKFGNLSEPELPPPPSDYNVVNLQDHKNAAAMEGLTPEVLQLDKKGNPIDSLANVALILKHDPAWRGRFRYNQFASCLEFVDRPPWRASQLNCGLDIERRDLSMIRVWFSTTAKMEIPEQKIIDGLNAIATPVHPVRAYLNSLVWDGTPRLDRILIDTAGAINTELNRDIGRCMVLGAVKRIFEPGCKQDYVVILEGNQGTRKSMWVQTLGGEWYSSSELVRGDKDTYQNLRGRWFVELPEINSTFSKADFNWLKGVISASVDVYRASYERKAAAVPRESIFIGTINAGASCEYLKDDENRRYLPVKTGLLEIEKLKENRDQYFAEAVYRYKQGEAAYITDPKTLKALKAAQELRREKDPWLDVLVDWLKGREEIKPTEIYTALGFTGSAIGSHHRKRLYGVLGHLGFEYQAEMGTSGGTWRRKQISWEDVV